ncbi:MAG: hypothetical protein IJU28_06230 [Clostridia bacterium]|nr:hypothetical protein [Clostridia bacterium]
MTAVERFARTLRGDIKGLDRLPAIEWATWWNLTLDRWAGEGLERNLSEDARFDLLGLDRFSQCWFSHKSRTCPQPARQGGGIMADEEDYERIRPFLYPEETLDSVEAYFRARKDSHDRGERILWYTVEGGFWFPRTLFGIEAHLYSFFDEPELYHRILEDLSAFQLKVLERIYSVCTPEFMTIAEDMSYNKGPMLSEKMFREFIYPYYRSIIPFIRAHGTRVIIDSDGDITEMVPWLIDAGVEGALPLEYQAGVDVNRLRRDFPDFILIGGFNKRIMKDGREAMEKEFERLLPAMRSGKFVPSVDHQTPPDVSLENYRIYIELLKKYTALAVQ